MTLIPTERELHRDALRRTVRYFYDLQKVRISLGNRAEDPEDYRMVVDKKTGKNKRIKIKPSKAKCLTALNLLVDTLKLPPPEWPEDCKPAPAVLDEEDRLFLRRQSQTLQLLETTTLERVKGLLKGIPIYETFLKGVVGCGETMAGVLISEISMWRRVDPVRLKSPKSKRDFVIEQDGRTWDYFEVIIVEKEKRYNKETHETELVDVEKRLVCYYHPLPDGTVEIRQDCCPTVSSLWYYAGLGVDNSTGRSVRKEKGKKANWSHFLKTKVVGVLAGSFLVRKFNSPYRVLYDNRRNRMTSMKACKSDNHYHRDAVRPMMKTFLFDLWKAWRTLEGMPTPNPYAEAKLGMVHGTHLTLVRSA